MAEKQQKKQHNAYANAIKQEQDSLVLQYMPALRSMAFRLKERLPASIDVNDLISIGATQMIKMSRKYDKSQNDSFWGYCQKRVYGSMLDYLRSLDTVSRSNRKLIKQVEIEIDNYFNKHEQEPDDAYLAKVLNESEDKIREARMASSICSVMPIDDHLINTEQESTEDRVIRDDLLEKIEEVLATFEKRDQLIVQLYYYEELSLAEISEILNISQSRISQIHKKLINKIKERFGA
ncbi:flagellar biosynthesis sigma factor [Campylobacter sputorum subsp. bubulus]|uniref:Flagellar biosynthesis sigma factor n=1 Tax=Campylobacter sputorum subsp. sputorum TaxID=32024 RepID=A0A381DLN4_9BACT|nr:RNA polymerase sigma factor FliA [Campylobacter sputorum]ASM34797.1 RNA polymerase sigma28 factor [Campylobacter sputorum aubsp. sputorum RM3237]ASM36461.1 RNA polymerase sigma28 factor [Campylobacter sputorum bv. faecalis CCUG 20703]KAB0581647.1 RNA polymerase sigma factor FliA [Campylobacter sputorum subsp. sputorum]QEL04990.1 RNA polymerase sigma28 factor [Campylobacter sputorum subsp. sputorum]SUX10140.1 flagellar biosynthesis sigma factor [Campylobacter sputorum subsp. bubulus]